MPNLVFVTVGKGSKVHLWDGGMTYLGGSRWTRCGLHGVPNSTATAATCGQCLRRKQMPEVDHA